MRDLRNRTNYDLKYVSALKNIQAILNVLRHHQMTKRINFDYLLVIFILFLPLNRQNKSNESKSPIKSSVFQFNMLLEMRQLHLQNCFPKAN